MLGVVIPAHNEEEHLGACLNAVRASAGCAALHGEPVTVIVVLDACTDRSAAIAGAPDVTVVAIDARNVGLARAKGAAEALRQGARWLAFTDADSCVAEDWLAAQLRERGDAVCGTVQIASWADHHERVQRHHERHYQDRDGHRHVHGANLGVAAEAYRAAGGFPPLRCHEDVALVRALQRVGASVIWSAAPRVLTSARRSFRAVEGFGATLLSLERDLFAGAAS